MKIVVTGGGGFVGSHVAEYMARKGNEVVTIDNLSRSSILKSGLRMTYNWEYLSAVARIARVKGDILTPKSALKDVEDSDADYDLADHDLRRRKAGQGRLVRRGPC